MEVHTTEVARLPPAVLLPIIIIAREVVADHTTVLRVVAILHRAVVALDQVAAIPVVEVAHHGRLVVAVAVVHAPVADADNLVSEGRII